MHVQQDGQNIMLNRIVRWRVEEEERPYGEFHVEWSGKFSC